jgi:5-methylcytosine-specific restriction enzyme subunit McrC
MTLTATAADRAVGLATASATVPAFRSDYRRGLDQALEIICNIDVSLNNASDGLALESFIISLDDVFEQYIRATISELPAAGFGRVATVDGNLPRH